MYPGNRIPGNGRRWEHRHHHHHHHHTPAKSLTLIPFRSAVSVLGHKSLAIRVIHIYIYIISVQCDTTKQVQPDQQIPWPIVCTSTYQVYTNYLRLYECIKWKRVRTSKRKCHPHNTMVDVGWFLRCCDGWCNGWVVSQRTFRPTKNAAPTRLTFGFSRRCRPTLFFLPVAQRTFILI